MSDICIYVHTYVCACVLRMYFHLLLINDKLLFHSRNPLVVPTVCYFCGSLKSLAVYSYIIVSFIFAIYRNIYINIYVYIYICMYIVSTETHLIRYILDLNSCKVQNYILLSAWAVINILLCNGCMVFTRYIYIYMYLSSQIRMHI